MSPQASDSPTVVLTEIYASIQGESTWAGLPCTFVRLTGCPLRCTWCDTEYAFHGGTPTPIADIVEQCKALVPHIVEITGGEPLAQKNCGDLAQALLDAEFTVLCETAGSIPINRLPEEVHTIMDLKCPGSGECDKNDWTNIDRLTQRDEVKFVIAGREDYEWSRNVCREHGLSARCRAVLFSPVFGDCDPRELVDWILADDLPVRMQLQMHKFIWAPDAKGV